MQCQYMYTVYDIMCMAMDNNKSFSDENASGRQVSFNLF